MGYTHYWSQMADWPPAKIRAACKDMAEIVRRCEIRLAFEYDEPDAAPFLTEEHVRFNGIGDEGAETFFFGTPDPEHGIGIILAPAFTQRDSTFCKTYRRPYDAAVVACLLAAKHHLGDAILVSSDGDWDSDWTEGPREGTGSGVALYRHIFPERPVVDVLNDHRVPMRDFTGEGSCLRATIRSLPPKRRRGRRRTWQRQAS